MHWRFRHFFVDEAQDLNPLQHALLEAWRGGRPDICLVGDPRQAIYGWNGSDHTTMTEVERVYPGVTVISLDDQLPVLAAGGQRRRGGLERQRPARRHGQQPARWRAAADRVVPDRRGRGGGDRGVRARRRCIGTAPRASRCWRGPTTSSIPIENALASAGIATQRAVGRSPLEIALSDAYRTTSREALALWADEQFTHHDPIRRRVAEEVDRFLTSQEPGGFRSWVDARTPFDDLDVDADDGAVSLLTFHGAKGREWPVVVVAGAEDGLIPHSSALSAAQQAEEARLLYVAITRAVDHLVITRAESRRGVLDTTEPMAAKRSRRRSPTISPVPPPPRPGDIARAVDPLADLKAWRRQIARGAAVAELTICSDTVLRSLLERPPADTDELAARLGAHAAGRGQAAPATRAVDRTVSRARR